ncbi:MAG: macro domain-containing protein [Verrucomicrobia bacterium]|nr:macro domain-containing protein [Verrucomicrobiota bacterium]
MSDNITFKKGNLFDSHMQTLTNTVNTVGIMGAGIAKQFKIRFPVMFKDYEERCRHNLVKTGMPYLWKPSGSNRAWVLNFPTKQHWRNSSRMEWIKQGLEYLAEHHQEWGIQSLAIPALGCSLGGLNWEEVKPVMVHYLAQLPIPVEIYEPLPEADERTKPKRTKPPKPRLIAQMTLPLG